MPQSVTPKRSLSTADERREDVLEAAMSVFAERGYLGTPTMAVAKAAGISQAYLFRLFPTKDDLVLAVVQRSCDEIVRALAGAAAAARSAGEEPLMAMGAAYRDLVTDRRLLLGQLHAHAAAASMPAVAEAVRTCFARLTDVARAATDGRADDETLRSFMAHGMLINVMTAIGAGSVDEPWSRVLDVCRTDD
jgi:AcrR family transcriptional regulator